MFQIFCFFGLFALVLREFDEFYLVNLQWRNNASIFKDVFINKMSHFFHILVLAQLISQLFWYLVLLLHSWVC